MWEPTSVELVIGACCVFLMLLIWAMLLDVGMAWLKQWVIIRRWRATKRVNRRYAEWLQRRDL